MKSDMITVAIDVNGSLEKVWNYWTEPAHITQWNFASDEWSCPSAVNDLTPGSEFNWRMEAKDGSMGFDFTGTYEQIKKHESISYKIADGRNVAIQFIKNGDEVKVLESFDAEGSNADEQQRAGWQAILDNFKKYVEAN